MRRNIDNTSPEKSKTKLNLTKGWIFCCCCSFSLVWLLLVVVVVVVVSFCH